MWRLEVEPKSSAKAISDVKHRVISPALQETQVFPWGGGGGEEIRVIMNGSSLLLHWRGDNMNQRTDRTIEACD